MSEANKQAESGSGPIAGYAVGRVVKWNYWTDRRESGWHFGIVKDGPVRFNGVLAYLVKKLCHATHNIYSSWMAAALIEEVPRYEWIPCDQALPPEGRDDIEMKWREVGTAKGGVPTHWRFRQPADPHRAARQFERKLPNADRESESA